ncbi:hypothetical protein [Nocardia higoensis]|uniref:hypothetical protein n=1 Tax=Nocardia higoensis TaxID=228599 RepID=UPI0002FF77DA|nr:hypothetical protein [Nocardia higoensis]
MAAGAAPVVLTLAGTGQAAADFERATAVTEEAQAPGAGPGSPAWPAAEAPNIRPYHGVRIPDDIFSSLQWARPLPEPEYLSPVEGLHAPVPVVPVPPIAPPPDMLRFGDVQVEPPEWLPREHAIQLNDAAAVQEAQLATFLDSVGMERTRSDRIASQTVGAAAVGAAAGAAVASPFALIGAGAGGAMGLFIGMPFAPIGLAAVPVGAAYGAALMAAPLAVIGAGVGATVGAAQALTAPPRALGPAPEDVAMPETVTTTATPTFDAPGAIPA